MNGVLIYRTYTQKVNQAFELKEGNNLHSKYEGSMPGPAISVYHEKLNKPEAGMVAINSNNILL